MVEVLPMMNNTLGKDQTDKLLASLLNIFLNEGYSAANTIGEIIVGNNNSAETPSEQTQNVLNDMKMKRSGATSLNYYK